MWWLVVQCVLRTSDVTTICDHGMVLLLVVCTTSLQGYQMNLKSTGGAIDVFVCPDEHASQDSGDDSQNTTRSAERQELSPSAVKKHDLDVSLASTASYLESPNPKGNSSCSHVGEDVGTPLWGQGSGSSHQDMMESLLQLMPESDDGNVNYYPTLHDDSEGLMDLFDINYT